MSTRASWSLSWRFPVRTTDTVLWWRACSSAFPCWVVHSCCPVVVCLDVWLMGLSDSRPWRCIIQDYILSNTRWLQHFPVCHLGGRTATVSRGDDVGGGKFNGLFWWQIESIFWILEVLCSEGVRAIGRALSADVWVGPRSCVDSTAAGWGVLDASGPGFQNMLGLQFNMALFTNQGHPSVFTYPLA